MYCCADGLAEGKKLPGLPGIRGGVGRLDRTLRRDWRFRPVSEVVFAGAGVLDCDQNSWAEDHGYYRQTDEEIEHCAHSFRARSAGECRDWGIIAHLSNRRKGLFWKYFTQP